MSTSGTREASVLRQFSTPGGVYNAIPPHIIFGSGSVTSVIDQVKRLKSKRALVVCTPGRNGLAQQVAQLLGNLCAGIYPEAISQVPIELAEIARGYVIENKIDCLVAVGGGAAIGLAKGISLATGTKFISIPTTYSGSEITGFCGITIDGVKRMHTSLNMLADTVIYDPELTITLPAHISAESVMNSMAHCIEALYVPTANPVVAMAALEGVRVLSRNIPLVMSDPSDLHARSEVLYGAYLGGVALTGGFALHHGVAHVFGGTYKIPHATAHSIALPYVTAFNESACPEIMKKVAKIFGSDTAAGGIYDLAKSLGTSLNLAEHGMTSADVERCTELVIETDNGLNPRPVEVNGVKSIINAALEGQRPTS